MIPAARVDDLDTTLVDEEHRSAVNLPGMVWLGCVLGLALTSSGCLPDLDRYHVVIADMAKVPVDLADGSVGPDLLDDFSDPNIDFSDPNIDLADPNVDLAAPVDL